MIHRISPAFSRRSQVLPILCILLLAAGCGTTKTVTIRTIPADASIVVDGAPRPRGPLTERFSFGAGKFHTILVTRQGYTDRTIMLDGSEEQSEVVVTLKPRSRRVRFIVTPLPAIVKVDGNPVAEGAVTQAATELEFAVDSSGAWIPHVVSAERPGYRRTERVIRFTDADAVYTLPLEPERKTVVIKTEPAGAEIIVDGTSFGPSPVTLDDLVIATDPQTNAWIDRVVQAVKPGYEPATTKISWDNGQTDYLLKLGVREKTVRVKTDPPNAIVRMGQKVLPHRADGVVEVPLEFAPLNATGEMPVYELSVSPPSGGGAGASLKIGWDDGKVDYAVVVGPAAAIGPGSTTKTVATPPTTVAVVPPSTTRPSTTQPAASTGPVLNLIKPSLRLENKKWVVDGDIRKAPLTRQTLEPDGRKPVLVAKAATATTPEGVVTSADGAFVAWTSLRVVGGSLRSQVFVLPTADAKAAPVALTDGEAVDLMPSFSPDGQRVLFASDRIGAGQLATYEAMVAAPGFAVRAAPGETADAEISPTLDSSPRPRLYVESRGIDGSPAKLIAIETVTGRRIDLGHTGTQPRVSPRADAIAFVRADANTGKRDVWLLRLGEDAPVNLTNSPDHDDFDPAWSKTGGRLAFASERPAIGGGMDINIWILRVSKPTEQSQVTENDARDDSPAWSGDDASIYFRSSRGGDWGVWRIELPRP